MPFATLNSARRRKSTVKIWNRNSKMICLTIVTQIHIVPFKGHYCLRAVRVKEAKVHIWVTEDGNVHNKEDAREEFSLRQNKQALPSGPGVFTYLVFDEPQRGITGYTSSKLQLTHPEFLLIACHMTLILFAYLLNLAATASYHFGDIHCSFFLSLYTMIMSKSLGRSKGFRYEYNGSYDIRTAPLTIIDTRTNEHKYSDPFYTVYTSIYDTYEVPYKKNSL